MATATLISLDQYLHTGFERDVEYVDGVLQERPMVLSVHGLVQAQIAAWFMNHAKEWDLKAAVEVRTRVAPTRVRLPDMVVGPRRRWPETLVEPPLLVVEIVSPSDTFGHIDELVVDYRAMRIPNIWIVQPTHRLGWIATREPWVEARVLRAGSSPAFLDLDVLFAALDEDNGEPPTSGEAQG